jgi:multicomponent Na+:H+ antiporter subunit F
MALMALAMLLALVRLLRGPSLADRVLAFDLMIICAVALSSVYAMASNQPVLLDLAVVLALISFIATVAFALYLERQVR